MRRRAPRIAAVSAAGIPCRAGRAGRASNSVLAGPVGRALDLGDRPTACRRPAGPSSIDPARRTRESTIDRWRNGSPIAELAAGVQDRQPRRRSRAARRAVDLAVGEDRHVALRRRPASTAAPRRSRRRCRARSGSIGMDDVERRARAPGAARAAGRSARGARRLDAGARAAGRRRCRRTRHRTPTSSVSGPRADVGPSRPARARTTGTFRKRTASTRPSSSSRARAGQAAARHVDGDGDLACARRDRDAAGLDRPGHERDRPVAARRRVALVVEEHDAEVRPVVVRRRDEAAVHVGVAARLVDEQPADIVEVVARPSAGARGRSGPRAPGTPPVTIRNGSPPVW